MAIASFKQRRRQLVSVNDDDVGSGGTFITMADLLAREDVVLDIEVRAKSCGPTYQPAECVRNHYKVEVFSMDPGVRWLASQLCMQQHGRPRQPGGSCDRSQCHSGV